MVGLHAKMWHLEPGQNGMHLILNSLMKKYARKADHLDIYKEHPVEYPIKKMVNSQEQCRDLEIIKKKKIILTVKSEEQREEKFKRREGTFKKIFKN